jgi:hypothetical protein
MKSNVRKTGPGCKPYFYAGRKFFVSKVVVRRGEGKGVNTVFGVILNFKFLILNERQWIGRALVFLRLPYLYVHCNGKCFFRNLGMYASRDKTSGTVSLYQTSFAPGIVCAGDVPAAEAQNAIPKNISLPQTQAIRGLKNQKPETKSANLRLKKISRDSQIRTPQESLCAVGGRLTKGQNEKAPQNLRGFLLPLLDLNQRPSD